MMSRCLQIFRIGIFLSLAATGMASVKIPQGSLASVSLQDVIAGSIQDESWTVIEYPEGREVVVELRPTTLIPSAKGTARVMRTGDETTVNLEVTGLTGDASTHQVYVIDSLGNATLLGALTIADGAGSLSAKTALSKLMLVVSPDADLTSIGPETNVALRSSVPEGFAVIPREGGNEAEAGGTTNVRLRTEATATEVPEYEVSLLEIKSLKRGADSQMRARLAGGYEGARANVTLKPRKNGSTEIKVRLYDLRQAEEGTRYMLWAFTPDNSYTLLGQVKPMGKPREAGINAEMTLTDFGLLITAESADAVPSSPTGSVVVIVIR